MEKEEHVRYWIESAQHDLETARSLFQNKRFDWCLFVAHLVLEKAIKATYVQDNDNKIPPKLHDLVRLAELTSLNLSDEQKIFLDEVNDFNLEVRYPDFKQNFHKKCTEEYARSYFSKIQDFFKWLLSRLQ